MREYSLFLHFKQGDDLSHELDRASGDPAKALASWGDRHFHSANVCAQLARALDGIRVEVHADTHHISFEPLDDAAKTVLERLAQEELIDVQDWEDEEEYDDFGVPEVDDE